MNQTPTLCPLAETTLIPLACRARYLQEIGRPDPNCEKLLKQFSLPVNIIKQVGEYSYLTLGHRTVLVDEYVQRFLQEKPGGTIVNLGCGLDTLFERNDNGTAHFHNVDFQDIIDARASYGLVNDRQTQSSFRLESLDWVPHSLNTKDTLIIMTGVSMYLTESQMITLMTGLRDTFPGAQLVFDSHSFVGNLFSNAAIRLSQLPTTLLKWSCSRESTLHKILGQQARIKRVPLLPSANLPRPMPLSSHFLKLFSRLTRFSNIWDIRFPL